MAVRGFIQRTRRGYCSNPAMRVDGPQALIAARDGCVLLPRFLWPADSACIKVLSVVSHATPFGWINPIAFQRKTETPISGDIHHRVSVQVRKDRVANWGKEAIDFPTTLVWSFSEEKDDTIRGTFCCVFGYRRAG